MIPIEDSTVLVLPKWEPWSDYDFTYGGHKWSRKGCEFYMINESSTTVTRLHVKPHRYFEAYARMKNEEAKEYVRSI